MVCYYDSQLDPSHFRLIQASVPEVLKWFSDLSASKRVEFVCGLLQLSTPPELRFYGSCLEEIARQDYESLHDSEIQANAPMENYGVLTLYNTVPLNSSISTLVTPISIPIPPSFTILNNNPTLRSKLIISLSLLNSTNIPAATSYFEMLMADESDTHSPNDPQLPTAIFKTSSLVKCKSSKSGSVSSDDSDDELSSADILRTINPQVLDEIMLIYTLAAFHPAFSFDQRQRLYKRLSIVKALSDHSLKITQLANQYKDPNKHALGGWTNPPRKSQSPSNYKHHSCLNFPARSNVPLCPASRQCRFHDYRGSVTRSLRRHSLPSDCLRSCGYESDENNKELIPIINPNTVDMHFNNKSDTLDVSSVTSIQTDSSSISRPDDSLDSNDEHYPRTARCLSCREYDSQTSNGELSIHDSDLNYLKEVHLWLKNPNRSVTTGDQFNSPNTISTKSSISLSTLSDNIHTSFSSMLLSNSQSTSKLHISDVMDSSLCLKQTLPASIYDNRLDLSADRQSVSELCINTTKTLTASDGTSIYKDLIRSSEEFTSCSPPINLSSINNSMYSSSSTSNGRVVATTSSSDFRFGAEKCLKTISDFCPLFPKRHSSGSSPISTPPSEESSSDSTALKASSPEYWTPKGASRYVRGMYTPYQSHGQTFRPVVNDSRESQIKNTSSSNRSSQTSHSMVVSQSSSISKRKSYNQFTLEDFPSLSTLRSMVNAESSNLELLQKDLFPQSYILLPSYPPTPIPATTTNILPYSTSNIYVNTLNSCGIVQNSPVCQASTTITTTICNNNSGGGGIDLITNSNNLPTNHQLNTTMMKQLNDERNLPDNKKIKVSNDTNICPISHEKTFNSINATGNSTTSPSFVTTDTTILTTNLNINRIHSSNRLIPHQSYGSNRIDIINTEETHKNPPVNTAENCDCSDSTNSNKPYPLWSTSETVCNPTWLYPRFPARPDSSNGLTSSTSGSQRTYPTRGYSPMNFNNSVLPRGYNQPPIASSFYYTQHPGLPLVPNSVSSHSQFIGSVPNPNVHFQQPHPLYGLVPSASSTSGASLNGYPGIPIASNSFKPNISSVGQSSVASVDPMPTAALLQNALIQIPNVPLLQNFVLHPPLHPTYPPLIPNLPANCPNNPAMTISSWSSINGPRIVSCYNCGQPGHKANVCPSRWSSQQLSESVFSLNYAPRK
ncbi:hypothetical protein Smp_168580 [Schistosoma mansoni]|uniref:hypothetical protein n=1 Tax=Schistosoma mansoni TaxID=6183 RepID=UPI0001A61E10|nr:hypothetical protein Smp_168580 [Schistosoma mansoni]|eukprot:XP_018646969.1 hypothetical protein Smp_168580 [Schistosoma mansoni]